jgi:hypothetical protein
MTATPTAPPSAARPAAPPRNGTAPAPAAHRPAPKLAVLPGTQEPPRIILNAVEGWGKTSCGAYADNPAILMAHGETGYQTLLGAARVPGVPAVKLDTWTDTLAVLDEMAASGKYGTLVLDAMGGFERLCHEHVCARDFEGNWGERGFGSFQKGYDVSVNDWLQMLVRMDKIRANGTAILLLSHCRIKTFKNPMGADFDRYVSDVHDKTWGATAKWADAVLFGNFRSQVETQRAAKPEVLKKGKGIGGTERALYTERRDSFDAKNRYGMPVEIEVPADPAQIWATITQFITNGKGE